MEKQTTVTPAAAAEIARKEAERDEQDQATRDLLERVAALLDDVKAKLEASRVRVEALRK